MESSLNLYFKGNWSDEQLAEMGMSVKDTFNPYHQMHTHYADQVTHDNISGEYSNTNGVKCVYYVASLDTTRDPIYHEDPTQTMERVFHISITGDETIPAEKVKFGRFVIEGMDSITVFVHRMTFFERNYYNLKQYGIVPELDPRDHNPIISERGGAQFNYKGYSRAQIFPKASDLIKPEWNRYLYEITDINTELPEFSFKQRKYFFGVTLRQYRDDHRDVSTEVAGNGFNTNGYIEDKFDRYTDLNETEVIQNAPQADEDTNRYWGNPENQYGVHEGSIHKKDTVTYRPERVPESAKNISDSKRFRPSPFGRA
jgi:hypothetical protein